MAKGKILETVVSLSGNVDPKLQNALGNVQKELGGAEKSAKLVGAAIGAAVGTGVVVATKHLATLGDAYKKGFNKLQTQTGATAKEMEGLSDVMENVYKAGFGESFEDVADAVSSVRQATGLMGKDLETVTNGAYLLSDTFGTDIKESSRAAKAMMESFGITGEEALNKIAAGYQNGLDYSGELIDSVNEYSVQFAKLGFSADDMFNIFQKGAESGAWNLDKVGDAIKEFSIRSIDGSKTTTEAYEALGLNAHRTMQQFAAGGESAELAFQDVTKRLFEMDDAVERDALGVALFGTQWEDLGLDAVKAMSEMGDSAYGTGKELKELQKIRYDNIGAAFESIKRSAEVALLPVATELANVFIDIAPYIGSAIEAIIPYIEKMAKALIPIIKSTISFAKDGIAFLKDNFDAIKPVIMTVVTAYGAYKTAMLAAKVANKGGIKAIIESQKAKVKDKIATMKLGLQYMKTTAVQTASIIKTKAMTVATKAWTLVTKAATLAGKGLGMAIKLMTGPFGIVIAAIAAVVAGGIALYKNWDTIKAKAIEIGQKLSAIWNNIQIAIRAMILRVSEQFPLFGAILQSWWSTISSIVGRVKAIFSGIIDFISNVFAGNWSGAWDSIVGIFSNVFGAIVDLAKAPINAVISVINRLIDGINSVSIDIPDWSPIWGGKHLGFNIPKIPTFAKGGFTNGVSIAGEAGTEAVISFNPAYRADNLSYWAQAGRMLGADVDGFTLGGNTSNSSTAINLGGVTFAPQITAPGASKEDIIAAIRSAYPEFVDMLEEWIDSREELIYA